MKYKRTQKRSKQMWQRVEKFSIRKFSFGAASCLIGASLVGVAINPNIVDAAFKQLNGEDGIVSLYSNSGETPESADGIQIGSKVNVDKEIGIDVDWSQYTRENPIVKVTYTYNGGADGSSVTGFGGHRPRFWFTTPIGLKEPKEITLKKNDGRPVYVMESWNKNKKFGSLSNSINSRFQTEDDINRAYTTPDFHGNDTKWESYNETTGESYREYSGSFANKFWYHIGDRISDDPYEQAIYESFRTNTKTMYVDWERGGIERATITAVYEVADPTFGNDRSTLEFGAGFRVGIARMMQHYKTVLAPVPSLYKLNEIFEPSTPTRVTVKDTNKLTEAEKNIVRDRLWSANKENVTSVARTGKNKLIENLKSEEKTESILIGDDGTATIIYSDNTRDVIPGTSLVYKVTETNTHRQGGGYEYDIAPVAVKNMNQITEEEKKAAIKSFLKANGIGIENLQYHSGKSDLDYGNSFTDEHGNKWFAYEDNIANAKNIGTYIGTKENSSTVMLSRDAGNSGLYTIPTSDLYYKEGTSALDLAKKDAEAAIDNLSYLSPKEKQAFKEKLKDKTTQESVNAVVEEAVAKNSENEKALEAKKREVKEKINNNPYLTTAEKKELVDQVSAVVMTDPTEGTATPIEHTKGLVDKILDKALEKTKEKAKAIIDEIDKNGGQAGYLENPTAAQYKEQIQNATTQEAIAKVIEDALNQKSKKTHDAEKAKTDALKDEYKKKIDQVPGLTDAQRDEYKKQIDAATTRDQLEDIVKDAEVKAYRDTAKAKIDALEHLNAAQKAELKTQVDAAGNKAEVDNIVSIAQGLDSKMDSLQKLVEKAKEVKGSEKYNTATQDKKDAFDTAKDAASKVADKTTAEPENAAGTSEVATLIDNLAKAIEALTGEKVAVPVSKDALKAELDLNTDDAVKKSPAYAKETDATKKKAYDDALANAQKVYDKQDATQTDVDNALETLKQARLALSGKAEDFTLAVKDGAAKISVVPKVGESLKEQADKDAVKAQVTANGKALDNTYVVEYGAIAEKGDKKVVPVTVTHDGITRTVDVPVEGTDAAKSPLNDPEKVKVNNVSNLSDDEKAAVKAAVKKANTNLTDTQISVDNTGKVTVTYSDKSQNELPASKTVEAKTEAEKSLDKAKEKAKADLTEAANKEKAEIEADKNLTDQQKADKKAEVDKVKKAQEANIDNATTPEEVAKATEDGKKAIDAVHQTDADKSTPTVTAGEVPVSVDPATDKKVAEADKKAITEAVVVPEGQPQPTDKQVKNDGAIVEGTGANAGKKVVVVEVTYGDGSKDEIEVPVRKATDKEKAKADLTKAADAEKAEIDEDNALSKKEKEALKKQVDDLKAKHEENINNATSPEDIASATEKGRQEIAAVHTPQDIKETAKRRLNPPVEKVKVTDINHLTDEEKEAVKKAIVATNPSLEESEVYVDDKGNVSSPKGILEAEKVVTQALNKPATPVVVADPNHLTNDEKEKVKEAVANANPGLNKDDITVDDKGNVTTKNGDKLLAKDVVTPALNKPTTPVVVGNPNALTDKEKEDIKDAVAAANPGLNKGDVTVNPDGSVTTPKGNLPKEDVVTTVLNKPNKLVEVQNPNSLTVKEKELVKKAVAEANPGLTEDKIKVDDQGNVTTPKGNLPAKDVVTSTLKKPTTPVEVKDPNNLTEKEKEDVKKAVIEANPGLDKKDIKVDDQGNVETPKGNLPSEDVVAPSLKKPTTKVIVKDPNNLTDGEKEAIKDAVVAVNPDLADKKDKIKVDNQGNVETPNGNLPKEDVVTTVLNKPNKLVEVENPNSLTVKEKEAVKKAVVAANPGLTEDKVKVDDQGNVTTPQGNLPAKDVVTSTLKKPTTPVEVVNPSKLTDPEKAKVVEEIIKNNPGLTDKDIKVDDQGNVETPKGNLPAEDVVTPALKKPTNLVPVKDVNNLSDAEKDAVKDAVVAANPGLNKDDVKVDGQGNVETPRGNLLAGEVVTPALKKPVTPVEVKDPKNLTDAEKDAVKDAVVAANPGLNKDDVKVDGQGNVETSKGYLPAKDVVTPALKKPVTPVEVKDSNNLTDKEKEDVKKAIVEANPGLNKDDVKVDGQGNVETPKGNLPKEDVVVQTAKGQSTNVFKPGLDLQTALVSGKATVEKGKDLTDEEILKQLALADGVTAKVISKPTTTETGTKEAEVEVTLADGTKVTVKVPVEVVDSLGAADKDNDLAKAKEDAKKQVEEAAKAKITEIKKDQGLTEEQKQKAEEAINKAKEDANKAIDEASSAGTAKQIADQAKENIEKYDPKADTEVKKPDVTNLDEEKAKAKAEILEEAQKRIDEIKNNKDLSDEAKQKAIEEINKAKDKAIEDINKGQSKDEINAAKEAGIHKINEVQPDGSIASKFEPKVPENKVEVENPAKLSDEEREQVRQNIEGANTFPDGTTVEVKPDGTAVITYKDGSSDTISKDKLVTPANKETGTIASRTEPVIPGKTQVGNTTKLTPEEQATVKKAVEEANNFPAGTTVEVRPDGTVVITYPDKSVDTITGDKLVEKGSKQETPKVQTDAEKNPAQVPGNFVPVENTHNLTQAEQDTVAAKVKEANPAATDVKVSKDGTATLTYGDGSVNTIPGTSLVVAKDTDNEASTQAAQNPAVVPATTEVGNAHSLTPEEQAAVATKVKQANPTATDAKVSKDGTATLTYSDGSVNTIPGTSLVVQKEETSTQEQPTIAEKTKVIIPANPTKVAEATRLTDEEKEAVKKAIVDANGFGSDVKVEVAGDGTATIVFKDGSAITIPGNQLVAQDPKAQDSTKPTAKKSTVKAPAQRVDVKDITHLTDEEKEKVKVAILQANGSALDGATINVAGDGTATITFPDGSVVTILGKDTVQQSAKGESVTQEATPEYKPETTPGGDNGGNTGSSDANANAGGGSQAGGQANTGSQNPAQSQASKQLATEKESAKKAIEKAAKDKQDEIKGSPLSDKEKAELLARVEAEKQAALKEIENAKTVEDVKEAETIGVQAIAMVTVPKRPVAPNAAPQATSAPQATAGTMQDVTYQSPAGKQLPNTGSASSAALASLGLVAATSGFALLGRKARRRK